MSTVWVRSPVPVASGCGSAGAIVSVAPPASPVAFSFLQARTATPIRSTTRSERRNVLFKR
jgi:hypothetical protein